MGVFYDMISEVKNNKYYAKISKTAVKINFYTQGLIAAKFAEAKPPRQAHVHYKQ
jgi:hypothetical protein